MVANLVSSAWAAPRDIVDAVEQLAVQALYSVALAEGKLDDVEDELFRFGRIVDREPALLLALSDPALPAERKHGLVDRLLDDKVTVTAIRLVRALVASPRGQTLGVNLAESVRLPRSAATAGRRVTVAVPLTEEQATGSRRRSRAARPSGAPSTSSWTRPSSAVCPCRSATTSSTAACRRLAEARQR